MKNKLLLIVITLTCFSGCLYSQNKQNGEKKYSAETNQSANLKRIDSIQKIIITDFNKHVKLDNDTEEKIKAEVRNLFADANAIVLYREKSVDWWLTSIAIIIALLTILFSFIIFFIGRRFYKDIEDEKEKLKVELDLFKKDFRTLKSTTIKEAREMNNEAKFIIEELKSYRTDAQKIKDEINELGKHKDILKDKADYSEKQKSKVIAQSIAFNKGATNFQRQLASAYDSYYSDDYTIALEKYIELLKNNKDEMTVTQLASIYYYVGYSYLSEENYDEAITFLQKSLDININDYEVFCNIGFCYQRLYEQNQNIEYLENAANYYTKAIEVNPKNEDDWLYTKIAEIAATKLNYPLAIEWYDKVISINKSNKLTLSSRIECLIFNNQINKAKQAIQEYRSIYPKESFDLLYNSILIEIIEGINNDIESLFNNLKSNAGTKIETTDWDFHDFSNWLESEFSDFVNSEAKEKLKSLNRLFKDWENENQSD